MDGNRGRRHDPIRLGPQVIGVDLLPHRHEGIPVDAAGGAERGYRLGERDRRASVQDPERLMRPRVHRHRRDHAIVRQLQDLDAECAGEPAIIETAPPCIIRHGTIRGGRVRIRASISAISLGALLMRSSPFAVMT